MIKISLSHQELLLLQSAYSWYTSVNETEEPLQLLLQQHAADILELIRKKLLSLKARKRYTIRFTQIQTLAFLLTWKGMNNYQHPSFVLIQDIKDRLHQLQLEKPIEDGN